MLIIITVFLITNIKFCYPLQNWSNDINCAWKICETSHVYDIVTININESFRVIENSTTTILNSNAKGINFKKDAFCYQLYLVSIWSINEIENIFELLTNVTLWHPLDKFIVIYEGNEDILDMFKIVWKYFVVNINVIWRGNIFTYFPYKDCGKIER